MAVPSPPSILNLHHHRHQHQQHQHTAERCWPLPNWAILNALWVGAQVAVAAGGIDRLCACDDADDDVAAAAAYFGILMSLLVCMYCGVWHSNYHSRTRILRLTLRITRRSHTSHITLHTPNVTLHASHVTPHSAGRAVGVHHPKESCCQRSIDHHRLVFQALHT